MKRMLILGASFVIGLFVVSTPFVFAVEHTGGTTNTTTTPTTTTRPKTPEELAKARAERIQKMKTDFKIKLSAADKTRLAARCKAAQGLTSSVSGRVKGIETSRTVVHANIVKRLTELSAKLSDKGADTTALNTSIAELKLKIAAFDTDMTTYKQTVSDLAEVDCAADPDGFKAALEAARAAQKKQAEDSLAIRTYVNGTIKPLLKTIRAELEPKTTTGGQ